MPFKSQVPSALHQPKGHGYYPPIKPKRSLGSSGWLLGGVKRVPWYLLRYQGTSGISPQVVKVQAQQVTSFPKPRFVHRPFRFPPKATRDAASRLEGRAKEEVLELGGDRLERRNHNLPTLPPTQTGILTSYTRTLQLANAGFPSFLVRKKQHVSNGGNMYLLRSPVKLPPLFSVGIFGKTGFGFPW